MVADTPQRFSQSPDPGDFNRLQQAKAVTVTIPGLLSEALEFGPNRYVHDSDSRDLEHVATMPRATFVSFRLPLLPMRGKPDNLQRRRMSEIAVPADRVSLGACHT